MFNKLKRIFFKAYGKKFALIGKDVRWGRRCSFAGKENIYLGDNISIGQGSKPWSTRTKIIIKSNVAIEPNVSFHSENHDYTVIGCNTIDVPLDKVHENFMNDIIVENDVWIGDDAKILSGAKIGRGNVIGAGAVVNKSIPPYAIVVGNPAKIVGFRFTPEEIIKHEKKLYSEEERLTIEILEKNYKRYFLESDREEIMRWLSIRFKPKKQL